MRAPPESFEPDDGGAVLERQVHELADLLGMHLPQAAAEDGEILREDVHQAPVDGAPAGDDAVGEVLLLVQVEVGGAVDDEGVQLTEGAFIEQQVEALAGGEAAALVLGFNALQTPSQAALSFELAQVFVFRTVAHAVLQKMLYVWTWTGSKRQLPGS